MRLLAITCLLVSLTLAHGRNLDPLKTRDNDIQETELNNFKRSPVGLSTYIQPQGRRDTDVSVVRRAPWSVIIKIFTSAITIGAEGYTMANIISGGCASFPSICVEQKKIERLETEMSGLTDQFEKLYYDNKWRYVDLSVVELNNKYIMFYIDDIMNKAENTSGLVDRIINLIEVDLRNMTEIFNYTDPSVALTELFGPITFTSDEIKKAILTTSGMQFGQFVASKLAQVLLSKFGDYANFCIDRAKKINKLWDPKVKNKFTKFTQFLDLDESVFTNPKAKAAFKTMKKKFYKTSLGFAVGAIMNDLGQKIHNVDFSLKSVVSAPWKAMKGTFKYVKKTAMKKMAQVIDFIKNPKAAYKRYKNNNYKFSKTTAVLDFLEAGMAVMTAYFQAKEWADLSKEIVKTRKEYEKYNAQLREAVDELTNEEKKLDGYWENCTETFTMIVDQYQNVTDSLMNSTFYDAFGLTGIDIDKSDPYFHTDFEIHNPKELKPKQEIFKNFAKNTESLEILHEKVKCHKTLIQETKHMVGDKEEVDEIYSSLKQIFRNFDSDTGRHYESQLRTRDVVCSVAMSCPALDLYDFYNTALFREKDCYIEDSEFEEMKNNAAKKRVKGTLYNVVDEKVLVDQTIGEILDAVKTVYSNDDDPKQQEYGKTLTRKDIVCAISERFPSLNYYRFYPLNDFRPDCSQVTDDTFAEMDEKIVELGDAKDQFTSRTDKCFKRFHPRFCPFCPEDLIWDYYLLDVSDVLPFYEEYGKSVGCTFQLDPCKWICPN